MRYGEGREEGLNNQIKIILNSDPPKPSFYKIF